MQDSKSLNSKTFTGLLWSFTDLMASRGMQFILQLILARLLLPEHFGLIGMVLIFIAISDTIVDSGFSQALIRNEHANQNDYSTVFYFNLMIAIVLYFVFYISAAMISVFFGEPQLIKIIRVLSLVLIINSFGIIQRVILVKKIDFKTITKVNIIATVIAGIITITMALLGYGVWSLVVNLVTVQFIQTLLLWIFNKWVPSATFKVQSFKKYYRFGYKLLLSGLLDTFYSNIYFLVIGRFYSTIQLGYYTNAVSFSDLASHSISSAVQRVSYPVLSSIQSDGERLRSGFRKIIKLSAFINFPLMIGLATVANPLFNILLGEKWIPSVIYFQLLCFAGMLYPLHAINLNILQVKGRSDLFLLIEIIKKAILTILIVLSLLFKFGIIGLIGAAVINSYISLYVNTYFSASEIAYSAKEQLKDLMPIFLISIFMGIVVALIGSILPSYHFIKLSIQFSVGLVIYIVASKLVRIEELTTVYGMLLGIIMKNKYILNKSVKRKNKRSLRRQGEIE